MRILLNGQQSDGGDAATIAELVASLELPPAAILVEHNGVALHRGEWSHKSITDGDRVEIIRVVAGG